MNWNYCECGCHGHEVNAGSVHLWLFNDLKGNFFLHRGHGWMSPEIGRFKSFKDADKEAIKIVKAELKSISDALKPKKVRAKK